jgi:hypothetical protein
MMPSEEGDNGFGREALGCVGQRWYAQRSFLNSVRKERLMQKKIFLLFLKF